MLPEQVWDYADIPSERMFLGQSAGSAQPLVWAHSEYLKLLRSATDGEVFDRIPIVAERYAVAKEKRTFANNIEIFQLGRPVVDIRAGHTLRIVNPEPFCVVYTHDNWKMVLQKESSTVGYAGHYADIQTPVTADGAIFFTLNWPGQGGPDRWLGRNIEVLVIP